jgi:hypothetical protein
MCFINHLQIKYTKYLVFYKLKFLVDKNDTQYFAKQKNYIERERRQTLVLIFSVLQLEDYNVIH